MELRVLKRYERQLPLQIESTRELLFSLCGISSQSNNYDGTAEALRWCASKLSVLGFECRWIVNAVNRSHTPLLVAERRGSSETSINLVGHVDTVFSIESVPLKDEGQWVRGSGVQDAKGGLVIMLSALQRLLSQNPDYPYSLRCVVSPGEELGSVGFHSYYKTLSEGSMLNLGFEPALKDGSIITRRRGNRWYHIESTGLREHAGRMESMRLSAAHSMISLMGEILKAPEFIEDLSVNVGDIRSGDGLYNVISDYAKVFLDVRYFIPKSLEDFHVSLENSIAKSKHQSKCGFHSTDFCWKVDDDCPPMVSGVLSMSVANHYSRLLGEIEGTTVQAGVSGGSSDLSYFSQAGRPSIDGLGPVGEGMHSLDEKVFMPSLETRAIGVVNLLKSLEGGVYV
ncbi:MAG: hypothetical protein COT74_11800 [Bdellovibrionales bacterium CG10_big_fil_rev_8_21_14_0_10_45_34]|nr:MAG: hypothetical protein COT74_11800 [Bdellovibrionales bacterium CG10_big_fil_rev_8_21_14_0_10_45_34]